MNIFLPKKILLEMPTRRRKALASLLKTYPKSELCLISGCSHTVNDLLCVQKVMG